MTKSPIAKVVAELLEQLKETTQRRREYDKKIAEYTKTIRRLIAMCDTDDKSKYLADLKELTQKPGFVSEIQLVLRGYPEGLTRKQIKNKIVLRRKMKLSDYSNPMASIHTTLFRLCRSGKVKRLEKNGEPVYHLVSEER